MARAKQTPRNDLHGSVKHLKMRVTALEDEVNKKRKHEEEDVQNRIAFAKERINDCFSFKYGYKGIHEKDFDYKEGYGVDIPYLSSHYLVLDILKLFAMGQRFRLEEYYRYETLQNADGSTKFIGKDDFLAYLLKHLSHALADDVVGIEEESGSGKVYLYYKREQESKKEKCEEKDAVVFKESDVAEEASKPVGVE